MDTLEVAAIGVSGIAILCLTPDATTRSFVLAIGMLVFAIVISSSSTSSPRCERPTKNTISARRASKASSDLPKTTNPRHGGGGTGGADLPRTPNPRHGGGGGGDLPKTPNPRHGGGGGGDLPKTPNPRHGGADSTSSDDPSADVEPIEPNEGPPKNARIVDPYAFQFTHAAMQTRRNEFTFRKNPETQTSEARARLLDNMYQELLDTSMKTDPGLRLVTTKGDGCEPMRGLTTAHLL